MNRRYKKLDDEYRLLRKDAAPTTEPEFQGMTGMACPPKCFVVIAQSVIVTVSKKMTKQQIKLCRAIQQLPQLQ